MPFTINGIGTLTYGAREFHTDGSYITTRWFAVVFLPVVPLGSRRILPAGRTSFYGLYSSSPYYILEEVGIHWGQVLSTWCWFGVVVGSVGLGALSGAWWLSAPGVVALPLPWLLRRRARGKRLEFETTSGSDGPTK